MQAQQEAQGGKVDQVSGQIQSLNDSLDEIKARLGRLEKLTQDIQSQQQSMSANMQNYPRPAERSLQPMPPAPHQQPPAAQPATSAHREEGQALRSA